VTNTGQCLGKVSISQVSSKRRGVVQESGKVGAGIYAALALHNIVIDSVSSLDEVVASVNKNTRLVVLDGTANQDRMRRVCRHVRQQPWGWSIVIVLLADAFADRDLATRQQQKWQIDVCLPTATSKKMLDERLGPALRRRQPISEIPHLPSAVSTALDKLWGRLNQGSYYSLLQIENTAEEMTIRSAFQNLAQITHPDRHRTRIKDYPECVERITSAYKRLSEAHGVLTHPIRRRLYDLCLKSGQTLRYEPEKVDQFFRHEIDSCQTDTAKIAVLESINARLCGDWRTAARYMAVALQGEPDNDGLKIRAESVKRICLVAAPIEMSAETDGSYA
jgi:hypothetical protein